MRTRSPTGVAMMAFALALGAAGCSTISWTRVTLNQRLKADDVAFIKPGETKWDEVMDRLGAPNEIDETPDGMVATYYYYDGKRFDMDPGSVAGYFMPPGVSEAPHELDFNNEGIGGNRFQVAFDSSGTVLYDGFSHTRAVPHFSGLPFESSVP